MKQVSLHMPKGQPGYNEAVQFYLEDERGNLRLFFKVLLVKGMGDNVSSICKSILTVFSKEESCSFFAEETEPFARISFHSSSDHLFLETSLVKLGLDALKINAGDFIFEAKVKEVLKSNEIEQEDRFKFIRKSFNSENSFPLAVLQGKFQMNGKKESFKSWRLSCNQFWSTALPDPIWSLMTPQLNQQKVHFEACFGELSLSSRLFSLGNKYLGAARLKDLDDESEIHFTKLTKLVFRDDYKDSGIYFELEQGNWKLVGNLIDKVRRNQNYNWLSPNSQRREGQISLTGSLELLLFYRSYKGEFLHRKISFNSGVLSDRLNS